MSWLTDTRAPAEHESSERPHTHQPREELEALRLSLPELLVAHRAATGQLLDTHQQLAELVSRLTQPAQIEPIKLTGQNPVVESRERFETPVRSVGLFNPPGSLGTVQWNEIGSALALDAYPVPAGKLLVLPVSAAQVEVGSSFAFGAGQMIVCFLLRFFTVQPAYYGG